MYFQYIQHGKYTSKLTQHCNTYNTCINPIYHSLSPAEPHQQTLRYFQFMWLVMTVGQIERMFLSVRRDGNLSWYLVKRWLPPNRLTHSNHHWQWHNLIVAIFAINMMIMSHNYIYLLYIGSTIFQFIFIYVRSYMQLIDRHQIPRMWWNSVINTKLSVI